MLDSKVACKSLSPVVFSPTVVGVKVVILLGERQTERGHECVVMIHNIYIYLNFIINLHLSL